MSLEALTEKMKAKLSHAAAIDAKVKLDFGGDGIIHIDATQSPPAVSHEDNDADTTLICDISTFEGFLDGSQDPNIAFMMGKLKVKGSMGLAIKLNSLLED